MPRKRGSPAAGISDLPRIAGGINENGGNDITKEEIVQALRACGEMNCSPCKYRWSKEPFCVDALIRDAADLIEAQAAEIEKLKAQVPRWIPVEERLPESEGDVLLIVNGKVDNVTLIDAYELGSFSKSEGWILEMWPEWEDPKVTHWMPLPGAEV